jgi:hypothetical protein
LDGIRKYLIFEYKIKFMNIFYVQTDPKLAAKDLCDEHILKMGIETAQLLCTAHWETGKEAPYKRTHKNHPSAIWARQSIQHYRWLVDHGLEIIQEFTARYGKDHKTRTVLEWCKQNEPTLPDTNFVAPPQAMPEEYKNEDTVTAYRTFYIKDKVAQKGLGWRKLNNTPSWL